MPIHVKTPITIVDFRVMSWKIYSFISSLSIENDKVFKNVVKSLWVNILNRGPDCMDYFESTVIVVDDDGNTKPYWRKDVFPDYKQNRKQKPDLLGTISSIGLEYVTNPKNLIHYISYPGFEADDLAGALVLCKRLYENTKYNRHIYLYTVDSDWMQLVSNGVTWINSGPWEPRIRSTQETIKWTKKRLKRDIQAPSEIVQIKSEQGDNSDNLPPNCDPGLIDLVNPLYKTYHFELLWNRIKRAYLDPHPSNQIHHLEKAKQYLTSKGIGVNI